jgi:hypothetical protein
MMTRLALSCSFALVKSDGVPLEPAPSKHKRFCQINIEKNLKGKKGIEEWIKM